MAQTTTAALQAALNTLTGHDVGSPDPIKILAEDHDDATYSRWYVTGHPSLVSAPGEIMGERAMWVRTAVTGGVSTQAALVIIALEGDSNVDANVGP
jgi:hypothetical protein